MSGEKLIEVHFQFLLLAYFILCGLPYILLDRGLEEEIIIHTAAHQQGPNQMF